MIKVNKIKISNKSLLTQNLKTIDNITNKKTLNKTKNEIGQYFVERVKDCFRGSRDPYGRRWKPLVYRNGKPLILTGDLFESIKYRNIKNTGTVEIYTNIFYAAWQNDGTGKIPARPFFPTNNLPKNWYDGAKKIVIKNYVGKNKK